MTPDAPSSASAHQTYRFPIADGKHDMAVHLPEGALPHAEEILDLIAPVITQSVGRRTYPDGNDWKIPEGPSLAALALLPEATRKALLSEYPGATRAALPHIAHAVHSHCYAVWLDLAHSMVDAQEGMPPVGASNTIPAAQIANALLFRDLLDAVLGAERHTNERDNLLAANLLVFERGAYPETEGADAMDSRTFYLTFFPETDYTAAAEDERERAMAYALVGVLSDHTGIPREGSAWREEAIDPATDYARGHLSHPTRCVEAVRLLQSFDPEKLRPMIGDGDR